ncbi:MAG: sulfotransferase family 2 domain-containing protein [Luminiphilus sp.]
MQQRNVLLHYHIFKNAGTTFERVLDENYGDGHIKFDGPFSFSVINQDQLGAIIQRHPNAMACSSHQIHLPPPSAMSFRPIPVVFIRNPLLRIRSVFLFNKPRAERVVEKVTLSDPLAGLEEWINQKLSGDKNLLQICNLQTSMLSRCYNLPPKCEEREGRVEYDLQRAVNNLSLVPCVGRVEYFDTDVSSFTETLTGYDIPFAYKKRKAENVSSPDYKDTVEAQLRAMERSLSPETWQKLHWLNHQDLALYEITHEMVEKRLANGFEIPLV